MSNHTPGPWKVTGELSKHCASVDIHSESNLWVADAKGCHDIVENCGCRRKVNGFPTDEEAYANARLIAAAPDLLVAVKALVEERSRNVPLLPREQIEQFWELITRVDPS